LELLFVQPGTNGELIIKVQVNLLLTSKIPSAQTQYSADLLPIGLPSAKLLHTFIVCNFVRELLLNIPV
jgi:hypothetical protein